MKKSLIFTVAVLFIVFSANVLHADETPRELEMMKLLKKLINPVFFHGGEGGPIFTIQYTEKGNITHVSYMVQNPELEQYNSGEENLNYLFPVMDIKAGDILEKGFILSRFTILNNVESQDFLKGFKDCKLVCFFEFLSCDDSH